MDFGYTHLSDRNISICTRILRCKESVTILWAESQTDLSCVGYFTCVRSYGKVTVLGLIPEMSTLYNSKPPFTANNLMVVRPSELDSGRAGTIINTSFLTPYTSDVLLATNLGNVFLS